MLSFIKLADGEMAQTPLELLSPTVLGEVAFCSALALSHSYLLATSSILEI
jgi:hypothetical protein